MKINDSEIIECFLKGEKNVFNIIIDTHTKFVYNICLSLLKNIHDSEDVTQEVFILIFHNLNKFNKSSSLKTWIYKITYNQCLKFLKKRKINLDIDTSEIINQSNEIKYLERDDEEISKILNESILELNPIESLVLNLFYYKEQSLKEISEITNLSNSNIRVILHRSRIKLFQIINKKVKSRG